MVSLWFPRPSVGPGRYYRAGRLSGRRRSLPSPESPDRSPNCRRSRSPSARTQMAILIVRGVISIQIFGHPLAELFQEPAYDLFGNSPELRYWNIERLGRGKLEGDFRRTVGLTTGSGVDQLVT